MRLFWLVLVMVGSPICCQAQWRSGLPEVDFDRRADAAYIDSLLAIGRTHQRVMARSAHTRRNDTLRLEGLRFMAAVFKQLRGSQCDSSFWYARQLEQQALIYRNILYTVRAMMLQEHYLRHVKGDYPQALQINQRASGLCEKLPRESSPRWQVYMNMGDIYLLLKEYDQSLKSYQLSRSLLGLNTSLTPKTENY